MISTKLSPTGGELILRSLKKHGVDYLFANAGSDFAPIVEAYAAAGKLRKVYLSQFSCPMKGH